MQPDLKIPTTLAGVTPLPAAPPSGRTIVSLTCNNPSCTISSQGVADAAARLGWTYKSIPFKLEDTSTFISAMDSALAFKPAFVVFAGVAEATWAGEIPKYKAAGVGIIPTGAGTFKPDDTIFGFANDVAYVAKVAEQLGDWMIQDSGGKGHVLMANYPEVPLSVNLTAAMKKFVAKNCGKCTVDSVDISNAQLASGASASTAVSAVQKNPAITDIFVPLATAALGLRTALDTAGRKDVKIGGLGAQYGNFVNVASGAESAWVNLNSGGNGYTYVDVGLHAMAGKKYQYKTDHYPPIFLVTKENLPSLGGPEAAKATAYFNLPVGLPDLFASVWKVATK